MLVAHFVVPPRNHQVLHPASGLVDAIQGGVDGVGRVRIGGEGFGVDVLLGELAANDKRVLIAKRMGSEWGS